MPDESDRLAVIEVAEAFRDQLATLTVEATEPSKSPAVAEAVALLESLTPEQRMEVFGEFCTFCGGDAGCYCMRDD